MSNDLFVPANFDVFKLPPDPTKVAANYSNKAAEYTYERLASQISAFQNSLNEEEEVGLCLISFNNQTYHLQDLKYQNPELLYFYCLDEKNNEAILIQNVKQLSFLLVKAKKLKEAPTRIGF